MATNAATKIPTFTMRELIEAGVHFGHKTMRWNPKMAPYLYGNRNTVHIIDLQQTVPLFYKALETLHNVAKKNGRILFVGTKPQASDVLAEAARRCGQYYVNHRWLGGMLTNWKTVSQSIGKMKKLEEAVRDDNDTLTKKEKLDLTRKYEKLERSLGGIRNMGGLPDILFVIDTNKEHLAIEEATVLGIPIVGILDSNCDPDFITFPIPGNDDAIRAIRLYTHLVTEAILSGMQEGMGAAGIDLGAAARPEKALTAADIDLASEGREEDAPKAKKAKAPTAAQKKTEKSEPLTVEKKPARKKSAGNKDEGAA